MISVQSHQPRLSGNKILIFALLLLIMGASACKSKQGGMYIETPGAEVGQPGIDTIVWDTKPSDYPPIRDEDNSVIVTPPVEPNPTDPITTPVEPPVVDPIEPIDIVQENYFNIAFIAPFYANRTGATITSSSSLKSIEFYTGAKMALDKLGASGINMKVHAYDSQGSSAQVSSIMNGSSFYNMDLVIGPMKTDPLKTAAAKVRGGKTVLVSPWNPKTSITSRNPNYVQVSPSLETHCQAIMRHVRNNHHIGNVVLACQQNTNEHNYFRYFQDENKVISGSAATAQIPELQAEYGNNIPLGDYFQPDSTIFIVPSWDEKFVSNFLRKLAIEKGRRKVVVYGMPQWIDFERIDFDYYERLNVHISSALFVDAEDPLVRDFKRDYFNKTGTVPGDDAFLGYDLTMYFGNLLKNKGKDFLQQIDMNHSAPNEFFHTRFQFERESPYGTDNFSTIDKIENKFVNILRFEDFRFRRIN